MRNAAELVQNKTLQPTHRAVHPSAGVRFVCARYGDGMRVERLEAEFTPGEAFTAEEARAAIAHARAIIDAVREQPAQLS